MRHLMGGATKKNNKKKKPHSDGVRLGLNFQAPSAGLEPATL